MYLERKINSKIKKHFDKKEYTIITGARQTGKTTLITQLFKELKAKSGWVFYLTLENADVLRDVNEKVELLKELKNSFLKRDIDESRISNPDAFYKLATILASQAGNLVNKNELANTIGVDNKTIEKYLFVLRKCFHVELLKPFSGNLRKELTKMPMVYFYDSGMRNVLLNRFFRFDLREDRGALIENYVFKRLTEKYSVDDLRFWRTTDNKEIDFVVDANAERFAYEVKLSCKKKKNNASKFFLENYPEYLYSTISYDFVESCLQALKL